jgi:mannose-6-phosphate isomerase-like protein (cupin superfamily)
MPKKTQVVVEGEKIVFYDLKAGEEIRAEVHADEAQLIRVGKGLVRVFLYIGTDELLQVDVPTGYQFTVPAGHRHIVLALRPSRAWSTYSK